MFASKLRFRVHLDLLTSDSEQWHKFPECLLKIPLIIRIFVLVILDNLQGACILNTNVIVLFLQLTIQYMYTPYGYFQYTVLYTFEQIYKFIIL